MSHKKKNNQKQIICPSNDIQVSKYQFTEQNEFAQEQQPLSKNTKKKKAK